jgi:hypothetical protein
LWGKAREKEIKKEIQKEVGEGEGCVKKEKNRELCMIGNIEHHYFLVFMLVSSLPNSI